MHIARALAQRRMISAVLLVLVSLLLGMTWPAFGQGGSPYCVAGSFQGWDADANPMTQRATFSEYELNAIIPTAGSYEFKITNCTWDVTYPPENSWFVTTGPNQPVTFIFRPSFDNLPPYIVEDEPTRQFIQVHLFNDSVPSMHVPGSVQGWDNSSPTTQMQRYSNTFLYSLVVPAPGTYEYKFTAAGDWTKQFNSIGRVINGGQNLTYTTTLPNQTVNFYLDLDVGYYYYTLTGGDEPVAEQDNNVWYSFLSHDSRDALYRVPSGAVPAGQDVKLRFASAKNDLTGVQVRVWNDRTDTQMIVPMTKIASDARTDYWEYVLDTGTQPTVFYYRFIAVDGTATAFYEDTDYWGGFGEAIATSRDASWQITVFDPAFSTPDWVKTAIFYQIFPDRFRDGAAANNQPEGVFFYNEPYGTILRSTGTKWNTPVCDPRQDSNDACEGSYSRNFYGGDLQGITQKTDYLESLGVTALYLNPIFESPSNHRYDTRDFSRVDNNLGGRPAFTNMVTALKADGFKLVLDGVFNHTSSDSVYFDRYNRYSDTTFGVGACESDTAWRARWYPFFPHEGTGAAMCSNNRDYPKWFGIFDSLPVLDTASTTIKNFIYGSGFNHSWSIGKEAIGPYWIEQGVDGWRLDVAPEVDHGMQSELTDGREKFNPFWEGFRAAIHAANPEAYIVGEEWGMATSWTSGGASGGVTFPAGNPGEWDATMNYQQSAAILSFWRDTPYSDNDFNTGSSAGPLNPMTATQTADRLLNLQERYAPEAYYAMMNLFGSHDTNRVLFLLDHGHPASPSNLSQYPDAATYDATDAINRLKGAALMQMSLPGAPTIYYGDEVGAIGPVTYAGGKWEDDPYNRVPYPWLDLGAGDQPDFAHLQADGAGTPRGDLFAYYQTLIATRKAHPALSVGAFDVLLADNDKDVLAYGRVYEENSMVTDAALVVVNRSSTQQTVSVNVYDFVPSATEFTDVFSGQKYTPTGGTLANFTIAANRAVLLVMTGADARVPSDVPTVTVDEVTSTSVTMSWQGQPENHYMIFRSIFPDAGFIMVGRIVGPDVPGPMTFEDTVTNNTYSNPVLQTGVRYFYKVVSFEPDTYLEGAPSNVVEVTPMYDLTAVGVSLLLQHPGSITHTLSTTAPTENIYARITIPSATGTAGATPSISAQVGYGATATPDATWKWSAMHYNTDVGGADEFEGALMPTQAGTFYYTVRFSADGGATWHNATAFSGGGSPVRTLTVDPSGDTTAPAVPQNLRETYVSADQLTLEWDAVADADLAFYRVYRKVSGSADPAELVHQTPNNTALSFSDDSVSDGVTYEYTVTAVDTSFNESMPSAALTIKAENVLIAVTFRVTVPGFTPAADKIYIVGDNAAFGPWEPAKVAMTQTATPNVWEWTGQFATNTNIEYKFTRGAWEKVEKGANGADEVSHHVTIGYTPARTMLVEATVLNWRDPLVTAYSPANGSNIFSDTPITVTWNRAVGLTQFSVMNGGLAVAGTYTEDVPSNTVTFVPTNPYLVGPLNVTVSGFSVDGVTQFAPVNFSLNVVGDFALQSPIKGAFMRGDELTRFTWMGSLRPTAYTLIVMKTSNQTRFGTVLEKTLTPAEACDPLTFVCGYTLTEPERALFTEGQYAWVVLRDGVELPNGPFDFMLDKSNVNAINNGSFEQYNARKVALQWKPTKLQNAGVVCNTQTNIVSHDGLCAFRFVGGKYPGRIIEQTVDKSLVRVNDTLKLVAAVRGMNADVTPWVMRLRIEYEDGSSLNSFLYMTAANNQYAVVETAPVLVDKPVKNIFVRARYVGAKGRIFIDNVSLVAEPTVVVPPPGGGGEELVPLPEMPEQ